MWRVLLGAAWRQRSCVGRVPFDMLRIHLPQQHSRSLLHSAESQGDDLRTASRMRSAELQKVTFPFTIIIHGFDPERTLRFSSLPGSYEFQTRVTKCIVDQRQLSRAESPFMQ